MPSGRCSRRSPWPSSAPAPDRAASASGWSARCSGRPASGGSGWSTRAIPRSPGGRACPTWRRWTSPPTWSCSASATAGWWSSSRRPPRPGRRGAVVFGSAHGPGVRDALRRVARDAGMALCGAGCMGFWNVRGGLRALGYVERDALPVGPVSLVTHSGSVFSTLLRTRLHLGFDLAVSSGQELVTTTADYVDHVVDRTETRVLALVLETVRDGGRLRHSLRRAREAGHRGRAAAGGRLAARVRPGRRPLRGGRRATRPPGRRWPRTSPGTWSATSPSSPTRSPCWPRRAAAGPGRGLATVHDSGAERSLVADLAHALAVPFARPHRRHPGAAGGPAGRRAGAGEPAGRLGRRRGHPRALRRLPGRRGRRPGGRRDGAGGRPGAGVRRRHGVPRRRAGRGRRDRPAAGRAHRPARGRRRGGRRPPPRRGRAGARGLPQRPAGAAATCSARDRGPPPRGHRRRRRPGGPAGAGGSAASPLDSRRGRARCCADYGIADARASGPRRSAEEAVAAADEIGWPVVLKTAAPGLGHRSDVGGVRAGSGRPRPRWRRRTHDLAARLGPAVTVHREVPAGRGDLGGPGARPAARADGRGGRRWRAGRAARRPGGRRCRRCRPPARAGSSTGCGCGRCSTAGAAAAPADLEALADAGGGRVPARPRARRRPRGARPQPGDRRARRGDRGGRPRAPPPTRRPRRPRRPRRQGEPHARAERGRPADPRPGPGLHRHADPPRGGGRARRAASSTRASRTSTTRTRCAAGSTRPTCRPRWVAPASPRCSRCSCRSRSAASPTVSPGSCTPLPSGGWRSPPRSSSSAGCDRRWPATGTSATPSPRSSPAATSARWRRPRGATATTTSSTAPSGT